MNLRTDFLPNAEEQISALSDDADLDEEPERHFETIASGLTALERLTDDPETRQLIDSARLRIDVEIELLSERKEERENHNGDEEDTNWIQVSSLSQEENKSEIPPELKSIRSILNDVDQ